MACNTDRPSESTGRRALDLQLAVVNYADSPDRCTIFPPHADEGARLTTWLSANRRVLRDLDEMR